MVMAVREYHSTYYVPHNLSLIIAGKLSSGTSSLLRVIQEQVEPSLIAHGQNTGSRPPGWKRPFLETASALRRPLSEPIKEIVEFPEQDESMIWSLNSSDINSTGFRYGRIDCQLHGS